MTRRIVVRCRYVKLTARRLGRLSTDEKIDPMNPPEESLRNRSSVILTSDSPNSTISHFCGFFAGVLKRRFRVLETMRSVLARKPSGYADSRCHGSLSASSASIKTPQLTTVYHSIIRGNSGRGIVKAKRSSSSERNTTLWTLIAIVNLVSVVTVDRFSGLETFEPNSDGYFGGVLRWRVRGKP